MRPMTVLAADDECRRHLAGIPHPERPERYDAIMDALGSAGLLARLERLPVRSATEDELRAAIFALNIFQVDLDA